MAGERAARLLRPSDRAIQLPLQSQASPAGRPEQTHQRDRRDARSLWLSAHSRVAAPRGLAGERQARVAALPRNGPAIAQQTPKRRVQAKLREGRSGAIGPNEVWAMDFVHDQLFDGRKIRALTIIDTFTRLSPAIDVRQNYRGSDVVTTLERATTQDGLPKTIRVDNGPEFVSKELDLWAFMRGVTLDFSRPGKPTDNAYIESFNGKFRAECLNANWFLSLDEARQKCEAWRRDHNDVRPHSSLGGKTPRELHPRPGNPDQPSRG